MFIAFQQWRTAREKVKLDLFDRRLAVFDATKEFYFSIQSSGKVNQESLYKFSSGIANARWLFEKKIADYLDAKFFNEALKLQGLEIELEDLVDSSRTDNVAKQREIKEKLERSFKDLKRLLDSYLVFKN